MLTIWKYELPEPGAFTLDLPVGAIPLSVQMQRKKPILWALVNSEMPLKRRGFLLVGTGHEIKELDLNFIGTFQMLGGDLIFHLFEKNLKPAPPPTPAPPLSCWKETY